MPRFKVSVDRVIRDHNTLPRNPFLAQIPSDGVRVQVSVRTWEFEADDEHHVRFLFDEAQAAKCANVVGFRLRSIERLPDASQSIKSEKQS